MKKYKNTLVAGGAGLLLGLGSMSAFATDIAQNKTADYTAQTADALTSSCKKMSDIGVNFVDTVNSALAGDWSSESQGQLSLTATSLDAMELKATTVLSGATSSMACTAASCTTEKVSSGDLAFVYTEPKAPTFNGGKNGDLVLRCQIGKGTVNADGDKCSPASIDDVTYYIFPVANNDQTPTSFEVGIAFPQGTLVSEADQFGVIGYLSSVDKCNKDYLKVMIEGTGGGTLTAISGVTKPIHAPSTE